MTSRRAGRKVRCGRYVLSEDRNLMAEQNRSEHWQQLFASARHALRPAQDNDFAIITQDKLFETYNKIFGMFGLS